MKKRVCLIVLDSVGIGALPDASAFGDVGAHTLGNIYKKHPLQLPHLFQMGLGNIEGACLPKESTPTAAYGRMAEVTKAKDTTSGHWEIAGLPLTVPFRTFLNGFPVDFIDAYEKKIGRKILGNVVASGTEVIKDFGEEHMKTGYPIIYTSADSVFQIAAHEEVIPLAQLYEMCEIAFDMLQGDLNVGRVIARPFVGTPGNFKRTENRKDFVVEPPSDTILDGLIKDGKKVHAIGKIEDIFAHRGITTKNHTTNNGAGIEATIDALKTMDTDFIFTNLVDFDMLYGHRNDVEGYANALEYFDQQLPRIIDALGEEDLLIITADHGCDPTTASTDHSREYIPCLVFGHVVKPVDIGTGDSFADIGASIYDYLTGKQWCCGKSFMPQVLSVK